MAAWRWLLLISDFRNLWEAYNPSFPSSPFLLPASSFELRMNFGAAIINATYISNIPSLPPAVALCWRLYNKKRMCEGKFENCIATMRLVITVTRNFEILSEHVFLMHILAMPRVAHFSYPSIYTCGTEKTRMYEGLKDVKVFPSLFSFSTRHNKIHSSIFFSKDAKKFLNKLSPSYLSPRKFEKTTVQF